MGNLNNREQNEETEIDLLELLSAILYRWWVVLICSIVGLVAALLVTIFMITPKYSATSMIYMRGSGNTISSLADLQIGSELTNDYQVIFTSRTLLTRTIEELELDMNYKELQSMITISNPSDTRILKVTVTCDDPDLACALTNSIVTNGMEAAEEIDSKEPYVIDRAIVENNPVSPNVIKNSILGFLIGFVLCVAVISIRYLINDTLQSSAEIEKYLELPVLCSIPESKSCQYESTTRTSKKRRK
ncbi:MAG: YveK family protein [Lachnospira sp.]